MTSTCRDDAQPHIYIGGSSRCILCGKPADIPIRCPRIDPETGDRCELEQGHGGRCYVYPIIDDETGQVLR